MRYRKQSPTGDFTFGQGLADFYIDNVEAVAQSVMTRLLLLQGEFFLNTDAGVPYATQVLGYDTKPTYDQAIRTVILETQGVTAIVSYSSTVENRALTINATLNTIYGQTEIQQVL